MTDLASELSPFADAAKRLKGWEFEYEPDVIAGDIPWNYEELASELAARAATLLDLGTGGGEVLSRILQNKNCDAFATEEWHINAPVAANQLRSIAKVTRCSSLQLPFRSDSFDLVLSRHEAIEPGEVVRVLSPGGHFLSQQVIHDFMFELRDVFPEMTVFPDFFQQYQNSFNDAGLHVSRAEEFRYQIRFNELGHLVYQLVATPWSIPGFGIESHLEGLTRLNDQLKNGRGLIFTAGYYLLEIRQGV